MQTTLLLAIASLLFLGLPAAAESPRPAFPPFDKLPAQADLPDPLVMLDGTRVTNKKQWLDQRRPELKALFQHYMYGYLPPPAKVTATIVHEDRKAFGGKATLRELTIAFGPPETPKIYLLLVVPNERKRLAPVFVGMNFYGNHVLVDDPAIRVPPTWMYPGPGVKDNRASASGRGKQKDVWALEQSIDRGYAVATFYNGDVDPDVKDKRTGIQAHIQPKPGPHEWGTIAAWTWGIHRVVDYLVTNPELDAKRIAVVGHSRLGKTALLAAALDDRIALAIPHQAGCGGSAPSRSKSDKAESVKRINTSFPHWFCGAFKQFNDHVDRLPFDQHCLVAVVAPRPVLFSNAVDDQWANPAGQFAMLQAAEPVYRLLGVEGLGAKEMPATGKLLNSRLGYYIRPGKHSMTKGDWKVFLDFADKQMKP